MSRSDLLELVYSFYPPDMTPGGIGYEDTEERFRQLEAARRGVDDYPRWKAMMRRFGERYPIWDWSLHLLDGSWGPAYSGSIYIPGCRLGFSVSLLGPCYGIHRLGVPGEEEAALDVAREIEATYRGYEPIPPELGEEVVPDVVAGRYFGKSTIYDCLLSPAWKSSVSGVVSDPGDPYAEDDPNIHYKDVRN